MGIFRRMILNFMKGFVRYISSGAVERTYQPMSWRKRLRNSWI